MTLRPLSRLFAASIAAAAAATGVLGGASAFGAITFDQRLSIENARFRITIAKAHKDADTTKSALLIESIENLAPAGRLVRFDTTMSNIFSVEFRSIPYQAGFDPKKVPSEKTDEEVNSIVANAPQLSISKTGTDPTATLTMTWTAIPVPGSAQTFDATVTVRLRADQKAEWDVSVAVTDGPYGVYAVRFPYLANREIPPLPNRNRLVTPLTGGMKLKNPVNAPNLFCEQASADCASGSQPEGSVQDSFFTYPGNMMTQFMAFYDPGETGAGLYMAAEDDSGITKNLYFDGTRARRIKNPATRNRLRWFFTHFNVMPSIATEPDPAARQASFRTFSLVSKLGYPMVTDTFVGDWIEATQIYRRWVLDPADQKEFVRQGKLKDRTDLDDLLKNTGYAYRRQLPIDPANPAFPEAIDPAAEYRKDQALLRYYDNILGSGYGACLTKDFTPLIVVGQYQKDAMGRPSFGAGDDAALPLRTGVVEWLRMIRDGNGGADPLRIRQCALNFDTAGVSSGAPSAADAFAKAVMRTSRLAPTYRTFVDDGNPLNDYYRTCFGSSWLLSRRIGIVMQTVASSVDPVTIDMAHPNGIPGLSMAALSGQGNFNFTCYAPWDPGVSEADHDHVAGGGNDLTRGWQDCSSLLRARMQADYGIGGMLLGLEHEPETLIPDQILVGRSFGEPYDDSQVGVERTLPGSDPVPLFKILYHDYGLWPAKVTPFGGVIREYMDLNQDYEFISEIMLLRYRIAQLAMQGRLLVMQVSQDPRLVPYEGFPTEIRIELQDEHVYFSAMAALRLLVPQYLIYGKGLRDPDYRPESSSDMVTMVTRYRGVRSEMTVPPVVSSAWKDVTSAGASRDSIGIVFTNFTTGDTSFTFSFKLSDFELVDVAARYRIEETRFEFSCASGELLGGGTETWNDTGMRFSGMDETFTSPAIEVPGAFPCGYIHGVAGGGGTLPEPWRVFRVVRDN